jgi:hypothetical protein
VPKPDGAALRRVRDIDGLATADSCQAIRSETRNHPCWGVVDESSGLGSVSSGSVDHNKCLSNKLPGRAGELGDRTRSCQ